MKIYISHSRSFNFVEEFYLPLQKTLGEQHTLIFPHVEKASANKSKDNSKDTIGSCDILIAEVTYSHPRKSCQVARLPRLTISKPKRSVRPSWFTIS